MRPTEAEQLIIDAVLRVMAVTWDDLTRPWQIRRSHVCRTRFLMAYLLLHDAPTTPSMTRIGTLTGTCHSTTIARVRRATELIEAEPGFAHSVQQARALYADQPWASHERPHAETA